MSFRIEDLVNLPGIMNAIRGKTPFADIPAQVSTKALSVGVSLVAIMANPRFPWHGLRPCYGTVSVEGRGRIASSSSGSICGGSGGVYFPMR